MSPEPVGSTHLRFDDARVIKGACMGLPNVVRSPGCDHGHDEESRNGRDVKIDILEAYIWISEVFRVKSGFYRSTRRLRNPPGAKWAMMGLSGKERQQPGGGARPSQAQSELDKGLGARPPLPSFSTPLSFPVWPIKAQYEFP